MRRIARFPELALSLALLTLAALAALATFAAAPAIAQDDPPAGADAEALKVPFLVIGLGHNCCHVVADTGSLQGNPRRASARAAGENGAIIRTEDMPVVLAALREATGVIGDPASGVARGGIVVVCDRDQPYAPLATLLMQCARERIARVFLARTDSDAAGNLRAVARMLFLPWDSGLSSSQPPAPVMNLRLHLRSIPGAPEAYHIVPDPQNEHFRVIQHEAGAKGLARMFWKLEGQLRDGHRFVGGKVEARIDGDVPVDALWRTIAALDRAEDGWADLDDSKHFHLTAPQRNSSTNDDVVPGAVDPRGLKLKPGADAFASFHVEGRLRVQMIGAAGELPEPPTIEPERILPEERPGMEDPTDDPRILPDPTDDPTEDPSADPDAFRERPDPADPADPGRGDNNALGMGGNTGAGGAGSSRGFSHRHARGGGGHRGDLNVLLALKWLRDHQAEDGSWDPVNFPEAGKANGRDKGQYGNPDGSPDTGWEHSRVGVTGLAVLAYLGAGYTHTEGEFANTVKKGLRYLKAVQDRDGCFDTTDRQDPHFVYGHAIATMAFCEAFAMTGSTILKPSAQKAVDFIATAQNHDPDRGSLGWRYGVRPGDSDTSVTGWMALALKSAKVAELTVPDHAFEGALRLLDDMTGTYNGYPKTGYIQKAGTNARLQSQMRFTPNGSMDAINIFTRLILSSDPDATRRSSIRWQADMLAQPDAVPTLEDADKRDFYYWYYGSLAMFQMGDRWWKKWEGPMAESLIKSQRLKPADPADKCYGSWDTDSAWGVAGGRVYTTALNCLTLQVYYRYQKAGARPAQPGGNQPDDNGNGGNGERDR